MTHGQLPGQEFKQEGSMEKLERLLKDLEVASLLKGIKFGMEFWGKRIAENLLLKLHLDIDTVQSTPGEAWLSKRVKFPSGQGVANQPGLSVAA